MKISKRTLFLILLLIGISAFFSIPFIVGVGETLNIIGSVGLIGIIIFVLNSFLILVAPAFSWKIILKKDGLNIPLLSLLKVNIMGYPINYIAPSMYLGSEPLKTFYLAKMYNIQKRRLVATIIVAKFQEFIGLVLLLIIATGIIVWQKALSPETTTAVIIAVGILTLIITALLVAFLGNFKPTVRLLNLIGKFKIPSEKLNKLRAKAEEMEALVKAHFTKRWWIFVITQLVTLLSTISVFIRPAIFFYFYKGYLAIGLSAIAIIFVLTQLLAIFHITPGGLGIFEGGIIFIFALFDRSQPEAVAFSIITRIADIAMFVSGIWLISHYGLTKVVKGIEKIDSDSTLEPSSTNL